MAEGGSSSLMDKNYLDRTPVLPLVCQIVLVVSKWFELGIQLQLDDKRLLEIDKDNPTTSLKRTKMFKLWLDTQPNATNRQLLSALRLKGIGENKIAKEYEDAIKTNQDILFITRNGSSKNKVTEPVTKLVKPKKEEVTEPWFKPVQQITEPTTEPVAQLPTNWSPDNTGFMIGTMTNKINTSQESTLVSVADALQMEYIQLLAVVQHFVAQKPSNTELIKSILRSCLQHKGLNKSLTLVPYWQKIDAITKVDQAFAFLVEHNFIGYLNFQLLECFSSEIICGKDGNKKIQDKLTEYKKCYGKLIEESSFVEVIQVFDEYHNLSPSTIIGLPIIVVTLTMEWKKRSKKDLEEWLPFLKENRVLLQSMGYQCILITYAVFPIDLLNIMDFLNDPNNIKTLKDNGISIETPSHTLEIEKLLREDERNNSPISSDQFLLQHLLEEVSSLKKQVTQGEEQRIADKSYWITQVTLLKAGHIINLEQFQKQEERFRKQEVQFQIALSDNNQKINDMTNELDKAMSTIEMKDRIQMRHTRTQKPLETKLDLDKLSIKLEASLEDSFNKDSGFNTTPFDSRTSTNSSEKSRIIH